MTRKNWLVTALGVALVALIVLSWSVGSPAVQAAPEALVTPVSVDHSGIQSSVVTLLDGAVLTATANSNAQNIMSHAKMDLQTVVDVGTVNTTSLKLQFSNDGVNWVDGDTIGTALTADTNTLAQYAIYGRYVRVNAALTGAAPITVTVVGVAK